MEHPNIEINKKILFVGHDANRAGAQLLLLRFLTLLKQNTDVSFAVLLRHGGELLKEFEALAPVYIWYQPAPVPKLFKQVRKMLKFEGSHKPHQAVLEQLSVHKFDLIVANTIANGDILPQLKAALKCNVLSYIHEMEMHIRMYTQPVYLKHVFESSDGYIVNFFIRYDNRYESYSRQVYSILAMLGDVGGL